MRICWKVSLAILHKLISKWIHHRNCPLTSSPSLSLCSCRYIHPWCRRPSSRIHNAQLQSSTNWEGITTVPGTSCWCVIDTSSTSKVRRFVVSTFILQRRSPLPLPPTSKMGSWRTSSELIKSDETSLGLLVMLLLPIHGPILTWTSLFHLCISMIEKRWAPQILCLDSWVVVSLLVGSHNSLTNDFMAQFPERSPTRPLAYTINDLQKAHWAPNFNYITIFPWHDHLVVCGIGTGDTRVMGWG